MPRTISPLDSIDRQTQALANSIKESISALAAQIVPLNERYRRITGEDFAQIELSGKDTSTRGRKTTAVAAAPAPKATAKRSKRIRRSGEELKTMAESILTFIKKSGSEGVKGSAIKAEFGPLLPSIKEFVKQHAGKTIKSKGSKAAMTYHHSD